MSEQLYVLGHPIGHSKSPAMYNAAYGHLGLTWRYGFMDCATEAEARAFLAARDFLSINITPPYKPLGVAEADRLAPEAALAGGANLLVRGRRGLRGLPAARRGGLRGRDGGGMRHGAHGPGHPGGVPSRGAGAGDAARPGWGARSVGAAPL